MHEKFLLNQARHADSEKSSITFPINLKTDKEIIVNDQFDEVVNQYNVYLDEREQCTTIRLTARVNVIANNQIFNSVTEIVKNEGSDNCVCLNYTPKEISTTIGKRNSYEWGGNITDAVMDTQITDVNDNNKNYVYLSGIDIFNNHILRSKNYFSVLPPISSNSNEFNTISDVIRSSCESNSQKENKFYSYNKQVSHYLHRYNLRSIVSFDESVKSNLINKNGWLGFINKGNMPHVLLNNSCGYNNVINNLTPNSFVDLFPDRTRYSIIPHYNKFRNRQEKNWEYCLTYPRESTTDGIPFINQELNTLKVAFIDETSQDDDSVYKCTIYSISKHGLTVDDAITLYRSKNNNDADYEIVESELIVDTVLDDYTFSVYTSNWVCRKWISEFDYEQISGSSIVKNSENGLYTYNGEILSVVNNYINADFDSEGYIGSQNLSFAKTVEGIKCNYYVRIFSRFPNFDFYDKEINENNIYSEYNNTSELVVDHFSEKKYEKQSVLTKLGYSKNVYGDDIGQIVYNDDFDINVIKDNLGRPLTSLYLTFFKTNYGYKSWYSQTLPSVNNESVEWSRCFGKLNCGFEYSPHIDKDKFSFGNIRVMNNVNNLYGLNETVIGGGKNVDSLADDDEVFYNNQTLFYGDLCEYSPAECIETVIQDSCHRFNTGQRELKSYNFFKPVCYDEIKYDDFSIGHPFTVIRNQYDTNPTEHPEGYYYKANYEIPIRSFSQKIYTFNPDFIDIVSIISEATSYTITTSKETYVDMDTNVYICNVLSGENYKCQLNNILDINKIECTIEGILNVNDVNNYKLYIRNISVPDYAESISGNIGSYRWRELVSNGFEETDGAVPEYPFVNGCLYINKEINLFLRRQDPFGDYGLSSETIYFGLPQLTGERNPIEDGTAPNINDAFNESDIKC